MQEIIAGLVTSLVDKDPYIENLVKKMKQEKRDKDLKKITNVESIDIFDQIKGSSPWSNKD
jgi:reverse gyrase